MAVLQGGSLQLRLRKWVSDTLSLAFTGEEVALSDIVYNSFSNSRIPFVFPTKPILSPGKYVFESIGGPLYVTLGTYTGGTAYGNNLGTTPDFDATFEVYADVPGSPLPINVPFMAALPDLNAGDLTTWTALPLTTWEAYSIIYKPGTPTMENFRRPRTLEECNTTFDNVNQSGVISSLWQNSPSDRDNARYVTTIYQTITDATLFNQGIQFSGKIKSRTLLSSYTVSAYIQTTGGSAQSNSIIVRGSTFTARLDTIPAGTTKVEVGFRFDGINLFAQNGVDGKLLGNLELENIQIGKPVIKGTSPWTGYVSGVSSTNATILATPIIPEASGSTFDAVNHTAVILPWWSNSADRDGAIYTLELFRNFYDPIEFNKGFQFSGIVESRTLLDSYKVEAFLKCWTSNGYDYGIQIFADVVNGCSFFVRRNSLPANTNRVAVGFRITGTNLLSQNGVDGSALGNVVLKNLLVEKTLFNDNSDYYLQTSVQVVENSYSPKTLPVIKSVAIKKKYYTRPGLTTIVNTNNPTPVDALFSKRTLTNILLDLTKVKWYDNSFLWSTYSDTQSEDPLGSLQFALENYNTLTVPLTPNAPTALQPYIPTPALTEVKAYNYLMNYKSDSYPNNHQLKQSVQIKPDPPNFPNMKFYTTSLTEAAKLVVDALPASTATKTYYANLYQDGVLVGTHNFSTNVFTPVSAGLVNAVSYTVKLYLVENGISTDEGTGVVVKYHDRPTLSLTGDFMYSSMASQVDPVDASKRLEAVLNLANCADMKGASGTATIVASGIVPGVIDLSTSSVNMSAVNYISLIIKDYLDGGHVINIVSVVGGWSIPNIDKVNYLAIGNVWDGPVTLIDSNIQDGILMGSRFKITTPTPLVLGSQWSRNGQLNILYVPLFPITAPMSIVVPSSLAMTGVVDISSATTTTTTENYILVQIHSYSDGGHDLYITTTIMEKDTADLRNMTYLKLGSVWDGPVTFIRKTGYLNQLRITTPTPLNFSGTNIIWNPNDTYTTYVKLFPVTLQPAPSLVTLPGMTTGMSLKVSVATDIYPNTPSVSKENIPLYLVDATVQVQSIDQNKNPRARDLFNELCTKYRYKVFLSDVPNSTGLTYTLNDGVHFPISTPLESETFLTEELTPAAKTAPTQTLSIYSTYLGTTPKQLIYKQSGLQVSFEPFIDYDKNAKTGKIFGAGSPITAISLIDRLGNTYTMTNTTVFTSVNANTYSYTFNNIPNSDFSGWMMMARNDVGVTDSLNGRFFNAHIQVI
jgi:hypothetical protein